MVLLLTIFGVAGWAAFRVTRAVAEKFETVIRARTGIEVYKITFGEPQPDCVNVQDYMDMEFPIIDYAVWLHFKTCPEELTRLLSRRAYDYSIKSGDSLENSIPYGGPTDFFRPTLMGDTLLVYKYSTEEYYDIETLWVSPDSTEVYFCTIYDQ
ncbi:MAG: hypothetical protein WBB45_19260 [Cyclobacteriaceae bacterium]